MLDASAARLERLRNIVQQDLDALPDRPSAEPSDRPAAFVQPQPDPAPIAPEPNTDRRFVLVKDADSSYNPKSMPKPASTTAPPKLAALLPSNNLNRGDLGSATEHYSPIVALSRYPYKWCNKTHSQDIASAFFDEGKFWAREWDL